MQHTFKALMRITLALMLFALATPLAFGQFRTSIQGTVADQTGAVVPGAKLTLTDKQTNQTMSATSNAEGVYNFNALPPSIFKLTVEMPGFQSKVLDDLKLIPEQSNNVAIQLSLGDTSTSITVSGDQIAALDTQTANIGGVISSNQIQHLPTYGRDVLTVAQLAPGVFGDGGQSAGGGVRSLPGTNQGGTGANNGITKTENGPQVIGNGNQTNTNNINIDGVSMSSVTWGGTTIVTPSEDSVDNVKVSSNVYDAEYGRFTGTNIQISSKSGTNRFHGSAFFRASRPGMNAYQRWNGPNSIFTTSTSGAPLTPIQRGLTRDNSRFNQWGGSLGGPIWKDKIFGFFNFERFDSGGVTVDTTPPWIETASLRSSARTGSLARTILTAPGIDAYSAGETSNNNCSFAGLTEGVNCRTVTGGLDLGSPLTTALGSYDPTRSSTSGSPGLGNGFDGVADVVNIAVVRPQSTLADQYNGRVDAQITHIDRLSGIFYWMPVKTNSINGTPRQFSQWAQNRKANAFTALWNHTFSPNFLNEARANAAGWRWNELSSNAGRPFGVPNIGYSDGFGSALPFTVQSPAVSSPSIFNQWTYGYQDIATYTHGRHTTKFGASLTRLYYLNQNTGAARPTYNFGNLWNFLNDAPYSENGQFNPTNGTLTPNRQDNRNNFFGAFVQDDWKATPTLTINYGIRYDYFGPFYDKGQNLRTAELGDGSTLVSGIYVRKGGGLYNTQKSNIGPQVGFAWTPAKFAGRGVIRGGFGINYNQNEMAITANGNGNPGNTLSFTFCCKQATGTNGTGSSIQYALGSSNTDIFSFPSNPSAVTTYGTNGLPTTGTISVTSFDRNDKTIQTYHYSLDTQYDLGKGWVATLGYQGSLSRHLLLQQDKNVVAAASGFALNPRLSRVGYYGNTGSANYNAGIATLRHNFAKSYQLEGQYTWSKSMDQGSQPYYQDLYGAYAPYLAYGRSDYNVGQAFRVFGMWQPKFFTQPTAHALLDGWTLTGVFNAHTGFPWNPVVATNTQQFFAGSGQNTLRPAAYLGGAGHDTSNAAFKSGPRRDQTSTLNTNYSRGASSYFQPATYINNAGAGFTGASTSVVGVPQTPGVSRNSFNGPRYSSVDASITKGFHLPNMPVLGEKAIFEFRVDAFNLFNQENLTGINNTIGQITAAGTGNNVSYTFNTASQYNFGQAQGALAGRTLAMQARFSF